MNFIVHEVGCDEAGRGPWAGPIVVGACKLTPADKIYLAELGVKDSKTLSLKKRQSLFEKIKDRICWSVGVVSASEIDKLGLQPANVLAYERAILKLTLNTEQVIDCDYVGAFNRYWRLKYKVNNHIKGESKFISIATASIIAKVWRDVYMVNLGKKFPVYNFQANAGYGTKDHIDALNKFGPCVVHRKSYAPIKKFINKIN